MRIRRAAASFDSEIVTMDTEIGVGQRDRGSSLRQRRSASRLPVRRARRPRCGATVDEQTKEILRLRWSQELSVRETARSVGVSNRRGR
jgi:hypothetical protein